MLIYEKKVNGVRHLFGTTANVPANADAQLKYKDLDGDELTMVDNDTYVNNTDHGVTRLSDGKSFGVFIGNAAKAIIPKDWEPETKEVKKIAVTTKPTKLEYTVGEALATTGMVVTATYKDGDTADVTSGCTYSPGTFTEAGDNIVVTVTHTTSSKTATFKVTVTSAE